jgi:hypothetical protein
LSPEEALEIKQDLQNYLECQIQSDWLKYVSAILNEEKVNTILIPTPVLNHTLILNQLQILFPKKKFVDWRGYDEDKKIVILDYNHVWKKRNIFTLDDSKFSACFLKHFFGKKVCKKAFWNKVYKKAFWKKSNLKNSEGLLEHQDRTI